MRKTAYYYTPPDYVLKNLRAGHIKISCDQARLVEEEWSMR